MRRTIKRLMLVAIIPLLGAWAGAGGQAGNCTDPGCLDSTFGTGGVAMATLPTTGLRAMATQNVQIGPDTLEEMIVGVGSNPWTVARFRASGALDTRFGGAAGFSGAVTKTFTKGAGSLRALVVQPDGMLVVAGNVPVMTGKNTGVYTFAVARYTADGQEDPTFGGGDGLVTVSFPTPFTGWSSAYDVALQADGKIVAVGRCNNRSLSSESALCAVRLLPDGELDTSFGTGGLFTYCHKTGLLTEGWSVGVQPSASVGERIVITAIGKETSTPLFAGLIIRLTATGAFDDTFGTGGIVRIVGQSRDRSPNLEARETGFVDTVIDSSNRIVAAGTLYFADNTNDLILARYLEDGSLDPTFGVGGTWTARWLNDNSVIWSIAIQPDGNILAAGSGANAGSLDAGVYRFLSYGVPDYGFGLGGWVSQPYPTNFGGITLVHKSDGTNTFVVGGRAAVPKGRQRWTYYSALWRYFY